MGSCRDCLPQGSPFPLEGIDKKSVVVPCPCGMSTWAAGTHISPDEAHMGSFCLVPKLLNVLLGQPLKDMPLFPLSLLEVGTPSVQQQ